MVSLWIGRPKKDYLKMLYQNKRIPMVFMDFYDDEDVVDCVVSASFNGMYRMTEYPHQKRAFAHRLCREPDVYGEHYRQVFWLLQKH